MSKHKKNRQKRAISRAASDSNYIRTMIVLKWIKNNGCYQETGRQMGLHASRVWYWVKKMLHPTTFHPRDWGGDKRSLFSKEKTRKLHKLLLVLFRETPEADARLVHQFVCFLTKSEIGYSTVCRLLSQMGWTWRVPVHFQVLKYTTENMKRYMLYLLWVRQQDWSKLKFMDESHIVSRQLHKRRVLGLKNKRTYLKRRTLHDASASLTIMTSLDTVEPVVMTYRKESNTQWDFLEFVLYCDTLVIDNAAVHGGVASWRALLKLLTTYNVKLVYLPCYSPELNPCELVFNEVKRRIRSYRRSDKTILEEVVEATQSVNVKQMLSWYAHCIVPPKVLPDLNT
eukprot:TRINITY_DN214_c0_g2_i3.p1 TRINITY_DN214_c0_g2~~TRINITY_DN214_c0_g2_i3.p1  ORF type:complete len:341 (-),score=28.50 TRINITY_DN214_c0_g2_i3:73-1095(-)